MQNYLRPIVFRSQHKPRFFEIDPYGHLSMVHYAAYFIEHRFQGMAQHCGLNAQALADMGIAIFCANFSVDFKSPVFLDTEFTIESHIVSHGGSTAVVACAMHDPDGKLLASCLLTVACIDIQRGKPTRWPEAVLRRFFHDATSTERSPDVAYSA
ncbi:MAG: acyl-CoA thioesterase [Deltaproteobacteria bacterium]|nr:acyl-CoA thioesterase [Deltaproteobacteria bacterium]